MLAEFKLRCSENGTWVGFVPDCVPLVCPWPRPVTNGKIYLKTQNNTIEALNKQVAPNITSAQIKQKENYGSTVENNQMENQFTLDSQILIQCDIGYKLTGVSVRTCTDREEWSSTSPSCESRECSTSNHPLLQVIKKETVSSNRPIIWKNDQSKEISGKSFYNASFRNLEYLVEGNTYMKKIIVTCKNNVEIKVTIGNTDKYISNITWFCNADGKWEIVSLKLNDNIIEDLLNSRMDDICRESICPLAAVSIIHYVCIYINGRNYDLRYQQVPENGYIIDNNNNYSRVNNSTITFKCRHGYILRGNETSVCLSNGTWSSIPFCTRKDYFLIFTHFRCY